MGRLSKRKQAARKNGQKGGKFSIPYELSNSTRRKRDYGRKHALAPNHKRIQIDMKPLCMPPKRQRIESTPQAPSTPPKVVDRDTRVWNEAYAKRASPKSLSRYMTAIEVMELVSSYHLRLSRGDSHAEAISYLLENQFRGRTAITKYIEEYKGMSAEAIASKFGEETHRVHCKACRSKTYVKGSKIPQTVIDDMRPLLEESYRSHKSNFPWMFSSRVVQRVLKVKGFEYGLRACQDIVKHRMGITRKRVQELQDESQRETWNNDLMAKFYILYILLMKLSNMGRPGVKLLGGDGRGEATEAYLSQDRLRELIPDLCPSSRITVCHKNDSRYIAR